MSFLISLPISTNWRKKNYNFILVIVNLLTTIVYYKFIIITMDILGLAKVIINIVA